MALELSDTEKRLVTALARGLPLVPDPYAELGRRLGLAEDEVIAQVDRLARAGLIKRFGVVVRHHELGYRANAMVVWDIPDDTVARIGRCFSKFEFVTLCYQRPRRLPDWPYNLFCMVHGRERAAVLDQVAELARTCGVEHPRFEVLFSGRRFKQRGAVYRLADDAPTAEAAE